MSMLGRLSRVAMLLVVAIASFLVTVAVTGSLFCLGYEYFETQAALRQANAPGRAGQRDKGEDGHAYAEKRRLAREYLPGAVGLIALISVAGSWESARLGRSISRGSRGLDRPTHTRAGDVPAPACSGRSWSEWASASWPTSASGTSWFSCWTTDGQASRATLASPPPERTSAFRGD